MSQDLAGRPIHALLRAAGVGQAKAQHHRQLAEGGFHAHPYPISRRRIAGSQDGESWLVGWAATAPRPPRGALWEAPSPITANSASSASNSSAGRPSWMLGGQQPLVDQ